MITTEQWCQALESGEWRQGKRALFGKDSQGPWYCCLGVGVMVAGQRGDYKADGETGWYAGLPFKDFLSDLPGRMKQEDGQVFTIQVRIEGYWVSVDALNDTRGYTFPEIAKVVRETVKICRGKEAEETRIRG